MRPMNLLLVVHRSALVFVLAGLLAASVQGRLAAQGEPVSIENGFLRVSIDARDGTLLELTDLAAGHNQVGDAGKLAGLWELTVTGGGKSTTLEPANAKKFRAEKLPVGDCGLRMLWEDFALAGTTGAAWR